MFELEVEAEFSAAHAITMNGTAERLHGHNWRVAVAVEGHSLNEDGLLCDFHDIERTLRDVIALWNNNNLNETEAFASLNPTAEHVAMCIASSMSTRIPGNVRIRSVSVTEAPGCRAIYRPPTRDAS